MSSKYPVLKPRDIIKVLESFGFTFKSQKGSHIKYIKTEKDKPVRTVIIPLHKEIAKGTLISILEQADLTIDDLLSKL